MIASETEAAQEIGKDIRAMNRPRSTMLVAVVAVLALAVGCGDSTTEPPPPDAPRPNTMTVSPATAQLAALGATVQLSAKVRDQNGNVMASAVVTWTSSSASVATVDRAGLVTAAGAGTATITATAGAASGTATVTVAQENLDRAALVALYEATDGPNWANNENWLSDAPLREWYGVDTDGSGRVVGLGLAGEHDDDGRLIPHGLAGPIPPELASLSSLRRLDLSDNHLTGPIPPELASLSSLERLDLGHNHLTGPIPPELGILTSLSLLNLHNNHLSGPIPPEIGNLSSLQHLFLGSNALSGPIPPELGNLAELSSLALFSNDLSGPIPPELGGLSSLSWLNLRDNRFTGPIPHSFLQLRRLRDLSVLNTDLCLPGSSLFVAWLQGISRYDAGPEGLCNAADVTVLTSLYEATNGGGWSESAGWLSDDAVGEWYGISTDSLGRVTGLDLTRNGLAGRLPATLGGLDRMTTLRIGGNALTGRLPLSLAQVPLQEFRYSDTDLCTPEEQAFRQWLGVIPSYEGTDIECGTLSDREVLEVFYESTGGSEWTNSENWLTDAPLADWHGVRVDTEGRVTALALPRNGLSGPIPPEIGGLAELSSLFLFSNDLSGPIPPEIGGLSNLILLELNYNHLTGPIPPEIGGLAELSSLFLFSNDLSGPIPPEIGNLSSLSRLSLTDNRFAGPIPPEIGNLRSLTYLGLDGNDLSGSLPARLGDLSVLESLFLHNNELAGRVPTEFGDMRSLRELSLTGNVAMLGRLPAGLTALRRLETLLTVGTGLCAPSDPAFLEWLAGVHKQRVPLCERAAESMAYLTQAVQSREFPVPLVAGQEALLRVFVTAARETAETMPPVRAFFYVNGAETHVVDVPGRSTPIPVEIDEGALDRSANAEIPGAIVQPGLEMVIDIDPDRTLDLALGVAKRIPEAGRLSVDVRTMPLFDLTLVPFLWTEAPDSAIIESVRAIAGDPDNHELFWGPRSRTTLPVGDVDANAHEPVLSSSNNARDLLRQTKAIRIMEGGTGHYMGTLSGDATGPFGIATLGGREFFSLIPGPTVHELGHSFNLSHAPCGGAGNPDPSYPYAGGAVGAWGYQGGALVPPYEPDLMSYCGGWISDYHFTNALRYRLFDEGPGTAAAVAAPATSLLLWGGVDADGAPFLEPAFVVDAPPALPDSVGAYRITGRTAADRTLFSVSFAMPETADGDGSSSFVFALPAPPEWADNLASITLSGPGGSVALDGETDHPMAVVRDPRSGQVRGILRDPRNGQVRGILRNLSSQDPARSVDAVRLDAEWDVLLSRGLPAEWPN